MRSTIYFKNSHTQHIRIGTAFLNVLISKSNVFALLAYLEEVNALQANKYLMHS